MVVKYSYSLKPLTIKCKMCASYKVKWERRANADVIHYFLRDNTAMEAAMPALVNDKLSSVKMPKHCDLPVY